MPPDAAAADVSDFPRKSIANSIGNVAWYASAGFWKNVGKYGIATPLLCVVLFWAGNGITSVVQWTGEKVVQPVVSGHTEFLTKTATNQETGNKTLEKISESLDELKADRRLTRKVLERLASHFEIKSDERSEAEAPPASSGGS